MGKSGLRVKTWRTAGEIEIQRNQARLEWQEGVVSNSRVQGEDGV